MSKNVMVCMEKKKVRNPIMVMEVMNRMMVMT